MRERRNVVSQSVSWGNSIILIFGCCVVVFSSVIAYSFFIVCRSLSAFWSWHWGPVHTYPDNLESTTSSFRIQTFPRPIVAYIDYIVFKSNSPVHTYPILSRFTLVPKAPLHWNVFRACAIERDSSQSRSQSFVPLDQRSENESSGSIHFKITKEINNRILHIISFVISKWILPELSFSNRWSRGTKLWEREWMVAGNLLCSLSTLCRHIGLLFGERRDTLFTSSD